MSPAWIGSQRVLRQGPQGTALAGAIHYQNRLLLNVK